MAIQLFGFLGLPRDIAATKIEAQPKEYALFLDFGEIN